jgi:beta-glucosidase-like glycosyl hydrolase
VALGTALLVTITLAGLPGSQAVADDATQCPWVSSTATAQVRAAQVLAQMTTAEKLSMTHGSPVAGYDGVVAAIPRLCIPQLNLHDGGAGVVMGGSTAMPAPIADAATFDPTIAKQYGDVVGSEDLTKGVSVNLGPNVNMERDPRGGRVFEGAGEDPYLTGAIATGYVEGVQSQGVMTDVKHLVANDTEQNRNNGNAIVDERTLNEIYYPAFKQTIQQGKAATVMAATSLLNGTHDNENPYLLTQTLKQDWGFDGFVVTDWDGARSTVQAANAGLDLTMPSAGNFGAPLTQAVEGGQVSMNTINDKVLRLLTEEFSFGMFNRTAGNPGAVATTAAHVQTAQDIAAAGTVLMKNQGSILPLSTAGTPTVAVLGTAADAPITGGGGSSHVPVASSDVVTPVEGLTARVGSAGTVSYITGGWQVTPFASASATDVGSDMVDGDISTRWSSGVTQSAGQSFSVDMGAAHDIDQITMDSGSSTGDYARGYAVYLSSDGTSWGGPVASGTGSGPVEQVKFPQESARYVKVVQTGSSSSWWSIAEFSAADTDSSGAEVALQHAKPLQSVPGVSDTLGTVPAAQFTTAGGAPGLNADYYNNLTLAGAPALTKVETKIDDHYTAAPGPGVNAAGFSVRFSGFVTAPVTGTYTFSMKNTGGVRMWIDNQPVFNDWAQYGPGVSAIHLTAGKHSIKVENYQPVNGPTGPVAGTPTSTPTNGSITLGWQAPDTDAIAAAAAQASTASAAIVVVNDDESEDGDRQNLTLPGAQDDLIEAVAKANPHTIVVLNTGAPVLMPWLKSVSAVVESWYGGQQNGAALASILYGDVNPSGKLPQTWPTSMSEMPTVSVSQYPGDVDVSTNTTNYDYSEGLDIGYRWYDANHVTPLFPFGFGLTYSKFAYSNLDVRPVASASAQKTTVTATVRNIGTRAATDVAQLYLGFPAKANEPPKQLKGFQRVTLAAGQSKRVTFTLPTEDFQVWDSQTHAWSTVAGNYQVYVGDSSSDLPLRAGYTIQSSTGARQVTLTAPKSLIPGQTNVVKQTVTAGGNQTLRSVRLSLSLPTGWKVQPISKVSFGTVAPGTKLTASWAVTPPASAQVTLDRVVGMVTAAGSVSISGALQVSVGPAVSAAFVSSATTVRPGSTVKVSLRLHNGTNKRAIVTPTLTASAGVTVGAVDAQTLQPGASTTIPLTVTVGSDAAAFQLEVTGTIALGKATYPVSDSYLTLPLVLNSISDGYNNVGVSDSSAPAAGNFDGSGYSYSAQTLAEVGVVPGSPVQVGAAAFTWPDVAAGKPNDLVAAGQAIAVRGAGDHLYVLGAASNGDGQGTGTIQYTDGTTSSYTLSLTNWTNNTATNGATLVATATGWNRPAGSTYPATAKVSLYSDEIELTPGKTVNYVQLPSTVTGTQSGTELHIFDMTLG